MSDDDQDEEQNGQTGWQGNDSDPTDASDPTAATAVQNDALKQVSTADIQFVIPNGVLSPSPSDTTAQPTDSAPSTYAGYLPSADNVFTAAPPDTTSTPSAIPNGTDVLPGHSPPTDSTSGSNPSPTATPPPPPNQLSSAAGDGHWETTFTSAVPPQAPEVKEKTIDGVTATWVVTTITTQDGRIQQWYSERDAAAGSEGKFFVAETPAPTSTSSPSQTPTDPLAPQSAPTPIQPQSATPMPAGPTPPAPTGTAPPSAMSPAPTPSNWDRAFDRNPNEPRLPQIPPYRPLNTATTFPLPNSPFGTMPTSISPLSDRPTPRTGPAPATSTAAANSGTIPFWQVLSRPNSWPNTIDPAAVDGFNAGVAKHAAPLAVAGVTAAAASLFLSGLGAYDLGASTLAGIGGAVRNFGASLYGMSGRAALWFNELGLAQQGISIGGAGAATGGAANQLSRVERANEIFDMVVKGVPGLGRSTISVGDLVNRNGVMIRVISANRGDTLRWLQSNLTLAEDELLVPLLRSGTHAEINGAAWAVRNGFTSGAFGTSSVGCANCITDISLIYNYGLRASFTLDRPGFNIVNILLDPTFFHP